MAFIAGALFMWWFMRAPAAPMPESRYINLKQYTDLFPAPATFPVIRYHVVETVETKIDTVRVPINRTEPYRLFYGDIDINRDRINIGLWNPTISQFEIDQFTIPQRDWQFHSTVTALANQTIWIRADATIRYKRIEIGAEAGYQYHLGAYAAGVIRYRIW